MIILGIETSCDETAAAVVENGMRVFSSEVLSQVKLHEPYGGVVPEIASRSHVECLPDVVDRAIKESGCGWGDIDRIAVTSGPGLASSLLVGIAYAKGLSMSLRRPLCGINHIRAHVYSAFLGEDTPGISDVGPFIALVVSGGHTSLIKFCSPCEYRVLGETIDDAAGEAFDKGAKLLGLGYPGGPAIDRISRDGDPGMVNFPRGRQQKADFCGGLDPELCFSFSGLKTSLLYYLKDCSSEVIPRKIASVAASYQEAIIDAIVQRCEKAVLGVNTLVVAGGVSLNSRLRESLGELCKRRHVKLLLPASEYCTDNAAMIAGACWMDPGVVEVDGGVLDAEPGRSFSG